jgi:hypothetical protein
MLHRLNCCLEGYALLRVIGENQGLEDLRRDLSARFSRNVSRAAWGRRPPLPDDPAPNATA